MALLRKSRVATCHFELKNYSFVHQRQIVLDRVPQKCGKLRKHNVIYLVSYQVSRVAVPK